MPERYFQHVFDNGLVLLGEKMPGMQSAAMSYLLPAGVSTDLPGKGGTSTVVAELVLRGAGERDSRQLTEHLDNLGLQRSSGVGIHHARFACAALADKVVNSIPTYADIIRHPQMPADGFVAAQELALQALAGIEDEPRQKLMIKLREIHLPDPFGRNSLGDTAQLSSLTLEHCKESRARQFAPKGAIFSVAGNIDFASIQKLVDQHFGDWKNTDTTAQVRKDPPRGTAFTHAKTEQTHIGIAYDSIPETHADYYAARMAIEVLGGGSSARLFTEIREKRGLCYSVGASYSSLLGMGAVFGYAGTSNERAQATMDCFFEQVLRLYEGVSAEELSRAKVGLKASTIMSGESTSGRSGSIAHDFFMRGRIRPLEEIKDAIDSVTVDRVNGYLRANTPRQFTVAVVGPEPLKIPTF